MEAKLAQRRHDLHTLLKAPSVGTDIMLAAFKEGLRKEAGSLHALISSATKQLKKTGHFGLAKELETGIRKIYAPRKQRCPLERLKPPSASRHFATRA